MGTLTGGSCLLVSVYLRKAMWWAIFFSCFKAQSFLEGAKEAGKEPPYAAGCRSVMGVIGFPSSGDSRYAPAELGAQDSLDPEVSSWASHACHGRPRSHHRPNPEGPLDSGHPRSFPLRARPESAGISVLLQEKLTQDRS